ncbi:YggU family protein [Salinivibrio proteolyticus]|uniref:DUF167 family protein n=1 Tax=Salinivibrio proteolyticus TaxID=334715 RepID=UPI000988BF53|nr:DUF167 family protein [Salinivibrio proteolyticus]OOF25860.1 YggU family protein [Salinivibrio proteolyticus]
MPVRVDTETGAITLRLYVQPKASRDQCLGQHGDTLKIAITAPPTDGKANAYLCRWLAKQCKIAKSNVTVTHGLTNRHKQVQIEAPQQLPDWLTPYLPH